VIGRTAEIRVVDAAVADPGAGRIVVVEGEAGIGKTTLLDHAAETARRHGLRVLRGTGADTSSSQTLAVVADLVADAASSGTVPGAADQLLSALGAGESPRAKRSEADGRARTAVPTEALIDLTLDAIEELTDAQPTVLVLDDLHWADPASLLAIDAIVRRTRPLQLSVLLGLRPLPRVHDLDRLIDAADERGATLLGLGPLSDEDVRHLLADVTGGEPGASLLAFAQRAGGNPFFLTELVASLDELDRLDRTGRVVEVRGGDVPASLRSSIIRRVRLLGSPTAALVRTAAIVGREVHVDDLAIITGDRVHDLVEPLAVAVSAGILVDEQSTLRFRHDLLRDAIVEDTPPAVRRALHRDAAIALSNAGVPLERVASHVIAGARPGDVDAVATVQAAASVTNVATAARLLENALELIDRGDAPFDRLNAEYAEALLWSGRVADALAITDAALSRSPDEQVAFMLRATRSHALFFLARPGEAVSSWEASSSGVATDHVRSLAETAMARLFAGELGRARTDADHALAIATDDPEDVLATVAAHVTLAWLEASTGQYAAGAEQARRAVTIAESIPRDVAHQFRPYLTLAVIHDAMGDGDAALTALRDGLDRSERAGMGLVDSAIYAAARAVVLFRVGRWDDALAEIDNGLAIADERGIHVGREWMCAIRSLVLLRRNDIDGAGAALAPVLAGLSAGQIGFDWVSWAQALLLEARGDAAAAARVLSMVNAVTTAQGIQSTSIITGADLVRFAVDIGEPDLAASVLGVAAQIDGDYPPVIQAVARRCTAIAAGDPVMMREAATAFEDAGRPYEAAATQADLAIRLAETGDDAGSREAARAALRIFGELGATRPSTKLRSSLRDLGVRVQVRDEKPASGWPSLTPTEAMVAQLAIDGLRNGDIAGRLAISRRTVESHLGRIYTKLGASSRTDLARIVRDAPTP
jgi:DNA-binding CsgD family transcriptional regulator